MFEETRLKISGTQFDHVPITCPQCLGAMLCDHEAESRVGPGGAHLDTAGWLYVAVLLNLYSRCVIGWAMRGKPDQQLALDTLAMAVRQRRVRPGLIHHSDQRAQYNCLAYQRQLAILGMTPSMSRKGNCYDNAVAESFFSTLKNE